LNRHLVDFGGDESMRAVVVTRYGGPDVLAVQEVPVPDVPAGHVLTDVRVAGVNYRDVYEREAADGRRSPPFVAGFEGAGVVAAVGAGVGGVAVGDPVAWTNVHGSYAERVAVPLQRLVPIPPGLDAEIAAAVLLQGVTAHYLATATYPVAAGDTILVHAAAGGTGRLLTQIARLRGARVIATTSTEEKAERARAAGADEVIVGYAGFGLRVRELTGGEGVHAVFDGVGGPTVVEGLSCLRVRGTLASFGNAGGPVPPIDLDLLRNGSLYVTRPTSSDHVATREELLRRAGELFGWVLDGRLEVHVGGRYPLADARRAQIDLESRSTSGKLLLLTEPA
jgi:NADPH2:quinone reductase